MGFQARGGLRTPFIKKVALVATAGYAMVAALLVPFGQTRYVAGAAHQLATVEGSAGQVLALAVSEARPTVLWHLTGGRFGVVGRAELRDPDGDTQSAVSHAAAAAWGLASQPGEGAIEPATVVVSEAVVSSPAGELDGGVHPASPHLPPGAHGQLTDLGPLEGVGVDRSTFQGGSLGLASALVFLDVLTAGDLTGGMTVAATGGVDLGGHVSPVEGIEFKAQAAARAGADVMFVPASAKAWHFGTAADSFTPAEVARRRAGNMPVVEVAHLADAVAWLCDRGAVGACNQAAEFTATR